MAFKKESWINNKRSNKKRHTRNNQPWMRGHAARAVDGNFDQTLHSCTILDNFYVEKPVWMVDLGDRKQISGVMIMTWQGEDQNEVMHDIDEQGMYDHHAFTRNKHRISLTKSTIHCLIRVLICSRYSQLMYVLCCSGFGLEDNVS